MPLCLNVRYEIARVRTVFRVIRTRYLRRPAGRDNLSRGFRRVHLNRAIRSIITRRRCMRRGAPHRGAEKNARGTGQLEVIPQREAFYSKPGIPRSPSLFRDCSFPSKNESHVKFQWQIKRSKDIQRRFFLDNRRRMRGGRRYGSLARRS